MREVAQDHTCGHQVGVVQGQEGVSTESHPDAFWLLKLMHKLPPFIAKTLVRISLIIELGT